MEVTNQEITKHFELIKREARKEFEMHGSHDPKFLFMLKNGRLIPIQVPREVMEDKVYFMQSIALTATRIESPIEALFIINEGWMSNKVPPSQDPNRTETLIIVASTPQGVNMSSMIPILTSITADGKVKKILGLEKDMGDGVESNLTKIFWITYHLLIMLKAKFL